MLPHGELQRTDSQANGIARMEGRYRSGAGGDLVGSQYGATRQLTRMRRLRQKQPRSAAINRSEIPLQPTIHNQVAKVGICLALTRRTQL